MIRWLDETGLFAMRKISKFLSLVLRHRPDAIGITLDSGGWTSIAELVEKARKAGVRLSGPLVRQVVTTSDKQRFCISGDGLRIRANHGHSLPEIDLGLQPAVPPEILFHGTARHLLTSIAAQGILPGRRQMVHLTESYEAAAGNGRRHGTPVVLRIFAGRMHAEGFRFYRSASGVWLTERVPVGYVVAEVSGALLQYNTDY